MIPSPNGETRLILIVGDPIAQVKSPAGLSERLAKIGSTSIVLPAHVGADRIDEFLRTLRHLRNLAGIIATVPHKAATLAHCDRPSDRATAIGACNVIRCEPDGTWVGDHTDGLGHLDAVERAAGPVAGRRVLLVGAGGAGSAIAREYLDRKAAHLAVFDIDSARRDRLIAQLAARAPGRVSIGSADPSGYDLVSNATPLGMREGDPLPIDVDRLERTQTVADVVTVPALPPLIAEARARGCTTVTGTAMFEAQADRIVAYLDGHSLTA